MPVMFFRGKRTSNAERLLWLLFIGLSLQCLAPFAFAHTARPQEMATIGWNLDPWFIAGLAIMTFLYARGIARLWRKAHVGAGVPMRCIACFGAGMTVLGLTLLSPLDAMGAQLFSMHMLQHELLMLVAAPLLVAGRPLPVLAWALPKAGRRIAGALQPAWNALMHPFCASAVHALVLWIWHLPRLFQEGLASGDVHAIQHASFLLSALMFWASLTGGFSRKRHASAVLYLLGTAIHTGVLGALLTFSTRAWYPLYAGTAAHWGLTTLEDQQLGGLIMWVPAGFVFVFAGLAVAAKATGPISVRRI